MTIATDSRWSRDFVDYSANAFIFRNSDRIFKSMKSTSEEHLLYKDYLIQKRLGRNVSWNGNGFSMPYMGSSLYDENFMPEDEEFYEVFDELWSTDTTGLPLPLWTEYEKDVIENVEYLDSGNPFRKKLEKLLEDALELDSFYDPDVKLGLSHIDVHSGNWLWSDDLGLNLIDFEESCLAPWNLDYSMLWLMKHVGMITMDKNYSFDPDEEEIPEWLDVRSVLLKGIIICCGTSEISTTRAKRLLDFMKTLYRSY